MAGGRADWLAESGDDGGNNLSACRCVLTYTRTIEFREQHLNNLVHTKPKRVACYTQLQFSLSRARPRRPYHPSSRPRPLIAIHSRPFMCEKLCHTYTMCTTVAISVTVGVRCPLRVAANRDRAEERVKLYHFHFSACEALSPPVVCFIRSSVRAYLPCMWCWSTNGLALYMRNWCVCVCGCKSGSIHTPTSDHDHPDGGK